VEPDPPAELPVSFGGGTAPLVADFPTLRERLEELGRIAIWAAARGAKVRLTYEMD
jgi:hypothetical protein